METQSATICVAAKSAHFNNFLGKFQCDLMILKAYNPKVSALTAGCDEVHISSKRDFSMRAPSTSCSA